MAPKVKKNPGFFGGPHCWSGRRGGVHIVQSFPIGERALGVGILNHMDMFSEKSGELICYVKLPP